MIRSKKTERGYVNKITKYLDKHLTEKHDIPYTYINIYPSNNTWLIRTPCSTRGMIIIKDGIIKDILLFDDNFCYDKKVFKGLDEFKGENIDLK